MDAADLGARERAQLLAEQDRRVDHGIDGEIELVDATGEALNSVVLVQSKASNPRHSFETADRFQRTGVAS